MTTSMIAHSLERIQPSATVAISQMARKLAQEGRSVIVLSSGEPDFDTPENVRDAAKRAMDQGHTRYTDVDGIAELKAAVADKFRRDNGLNVSPAECFIGAGGKQIIFNALQATLNPGDEVIIPVPFWVSYPEIVRLSGAEPVLVEGSAENGFRITPEQLEAAITPRTKWLILNSPSNPTGAAYSAAQLSDLAAVLLRHEHVHVMSDDIYEKLVYDGEPFATIASVEPRIANRVLTVNGVSKSHAMTGWRIGYCKGPAPILKAMVKLQGQSTTNPSSVAQWAALEALTGPQDFLAEWRDVFKSRRDYVVSRLNAMSGLSCPVPDGAFYVFPSCAGLIGRTSAGGKRLASDYEVVMSLLEEEGVALVHGTAFGMPGYMRLSYAASMEELTTALDRIKAFCAGCR
jgi:aspartate aminotransferase